MISGIHHINLVVPPNTLPHAQSFYGTTLSLTPRPVPVLQKDTLLWFDIGTSGQQVHIALGQPADFTLQSSRHVCFRVTGGKEALRELQERVYAHFLSGGDAAPLQADRPGEESSGAKGVEYPVRFFAR